MPVVQAGGLPLLGGGGGGGGGGGFGGGGGGGDGDHLGDDATGEDVYLGVEH